MFQMAREIQLDTNAFDFHSQHRFTLRRFFWKASLLRQFLEFYKENDSWIYNIAALKVCRIYVVYFFLSSLWGVVCLYISLCTIGLCQQYRENIHPPVLTPHHKGGETRTPLRKLLQKTARRYNKRKSLRAVLQGCDVSEYPPSNRESHRRRWRAKTCARPGQDRRVGKW